MEQSELTRGRTTGRLRYLAVGALAFQAVHLVEHIAQLGYWMTRPWEVPWLTPWAVEGRNALAVGGDAALGNEMLHLVGNLIFLGGLGALLAYCRRRALGTPSALRIASVIQGIHVAEHVALTTTAAMWRMAIGLSTFVGLVEGPVMTSYRVWFHFLINLAASWYAARAVMAVHARGLLVDQIPRPGSTPAMSEGTGA